MVELLVLSPHLDDAVFSCGRLLACSRGSVVATLFAASPSPAQPTNWDRTCGFSNSDVAVAARRREDEAGLQLLGSSPQHCEILDGQYVQSAGRDDRLAAEIQHLVALFKPVVLATPLGLFHGDHVAVRDGTLASLAQNFDGRWLVYEDLPYARWDNAADECTMARDAFVRAGRLLETFDFELDRGFGRKLAAIRCYASQLPAVMAATRPRASKLVLPAGDTSDEALRRVFEDEHYRLAATQFRQ